MHGFERRHTVAQALAWLDAYLRPLDSETVPLRDAAGRVLAADVISDVDVPAFARATMDGYAVVADATDGASAYNPITLRVVGEALPGRPFAGSVSRDDAVRIMTGAPLPADTDAVVPAEFVESDPHAPELVAVLSSVSRTKNIGTRGEDVLAGTTVLPTGRVLRPQDLGVMSSIGIADARVVRQPRVRLVITGNELLSSGSRPHGFFITDANGPMLAALATRDGAVVEFPGIVRDEAEDILAALVGPPEGGPHDSLVDDDAHMGAAFRRPETNAALGAAFRRAETNATVGAAFRRPDHVDAPDIIIVSGGSSVGIEDLAPTLVAKHGELAVHGIAMRPSSPTGMGRIGEALVFLLPGNPVSALCAYDFFAGRAIRALGGRSKEWPYRSVRGRLTRKISSPIGRLDYARVKVSGADVEPLTVGGASILSSTTRADGFVIVADDSEGFPAGTDVDIWLYA